MPGVWRVQGLLFFANFLAILAVSSIIFVVTGFVRKSEMGSALAVAKRYAIAGLGLVVVAYLLTMSLVDIVRDRWRSKTIDQVLNAEFRSIPATTLTEAKHIHTGDGLEILAIARTPRVMSPSRIKQIQGNLTQALDQNATLVVRCSLTKDITATGSTSGVSADNLDGALIQSNLASEVEMVQLAEQALREAIENRPDLTLDDITLERMDDDVIAVAKMSSFRDILPMEVKEFEECLRKRMGAPNIRLLMRTNEYIDTTNKGRILFGQAHFGEFSKPLAEVKRALERTVKKAIAGYDHLFATSVDAVPRGAEWAVRAAIVGDRVITPEEVRAVEQTAAQDVGVKVALTAWSRIDLMVTAESYDSVQDYTTRQFIQRQAQSEDFGR